MGVLAATICNCGTIHLPPRARCIKCSSPTGPVEIPAVGTILTYTVLYAVPEGFSSPLILGLIEVGTEQNPNYQKTHQQQGNPKIICRGIILETDLQIGLKVSIENIDNKYYFSKI